ncbi:beta-lactamase/transpeptidase-like protein [Mycena alexandri]|uniref:Beta-lactamase/transpeptidase-like protein n=1 Tax=Mycena alexandri TaxID=1745969 RepID=A0AAD6S4I9_9AGAR|nr:beta-lactamase/transpeptidase-like protein [Mycena alexandri]
MAPTLSTTSKEAIDRMLAEAVSSKSMPALFFGVTTAEGPIYMQTEGTKLVDDPASGAIDEDTVYYLASQTKLITSIAALQLLEQGKITLDTPAEGILPGLGNPVIVTGHDEEGNPITIPAQGKITFGQLLNHTSGLDSSAAKKTAHDMSEVYSHCGADLATYFNVLKGSLPGVPLKFEPGSDFVYGFSSDCVGFIVEKLSGKSLDQYFKDHIFSPLGITSASFYLTPALKERLLPLSYRNKNGVLERWNGPLPFEQDPAKLRMNYGGMGLYASQKDYLTLLRHLLQIKAGTAATPILSLASVEALFTPTLPAAGAASLSQFLRLPPGSVQYSCGFFVTIMDFPGLRKKGTGAWGGAAHTNFFIDPTTGVAGILATQLHPRADKTHFRLCLETEKELYGGLNVGA